MNSVKKKRKIKFWRKIRKKKQKLIDLELQVFGNQDLWRHIKSFTFDERKENQLCEFCKKTKTSKFIYESHSAKVYRDGKWRLTNFRVKKYSCFLCTELREETHFFGKRCSIM